MSNFSYISPLLINFIDKSVNCDKVTKCVKYDRVYGVRVMLLVNNFVVICIISRKWAMLDAWHRPHDDAMNMNKGVRNRRLICGVDDGGSWDSGHVKNVTVVMGVIVTISTINVPKQIECRTMLRLLACGYYRSALREMPATRFFLSLPLPGDNQKKCHTFWAIINLQIFSE